jgi:hypothetical protein
MIAEAAGAENEQLAARLDQRCAALDRAAAAAHAAHTAAAGWAFEWVSGGLWEGVGGAAGGYQLAA